jgi:hypothetical protein
MINKLKIILNNHYSIYSKLFKIIIINFIKFIVFDINYFIIQF